MSAIIGIIFPIPANLTLSIFQKSSIVFVKYLTHSSTNMVKGNKIIFYESGGSKILVGEGKINKIEFLTPDEVLKNYKDTLFLDEKQFDAYVKLRPNRSLSKKMLTVKLVNMKKYENPIKYGKPITMGGKYIKTDEYYNLLNLDKLTEP